MSLEVKSNTRVHLRDAIGVVLRFSYLKIIPRMSTLRQKGFRVRVCHELFKAPKHVKRIKPAL